VASDDQPDAREGQVGRPCGHAAASTPVQQLGVIFAHSPNRISLPRYGRRVGLHIDLSRLAQRSLALRPAHLRCHQFRDTLIEGFSHFVTSMTAPIASGWSGCRVGLAPTGKPRLCTAHANSGQSQSDVMDVCFSPRCGDRSPPEPRQLCANKRLALAVFPQEPQPQNCALTAYVG